MSAGEPVSTQTRAAIAAWLDYLASIGVREIRCPATLVATSAPPRPAPPQKPRTAKSPGAAPPLAPPPRAAKPASTPAPMKARPLAPPPQAAKPALAPAPVKARPLAPPPAPPVRAPRRPGDEASAPPSVAIERLAAIRTELGECTRCKLHGGRKQIVFGVGNPAARIMFIGEAPGAEEDARGEPFVGRAGKKLDQMIQSIGFRREDVYIANIVKCRPPNNRDPEADEVATCFPFLARQIAAIAPEVIVTLGAPATRALLDTRVGIMRLRGCWHRYRDIPVMPTYHPAYLLRAYTNENRRNMYDDLLAARAKLDEAAK